MVHGLRIDIIIQGLLGRLPKSGDVWPEADRKLWQDLLAGSFKLIYKDADPAEMKEFLAEIQKKG
jgi:hypothetical protein